MPLNTSITKNISTIKSLQYRALLLSLLSTISLSSCETLFGTYTGDDNDQKKNKQELVTLGDISDRPVQFRRVKVRNVSAKDTIDSYQSVLDNTEDPDFKFESTRRIADLSLIVVEDQLIKQADLADAADEIYADAGKIAKRKAKDAAAVAARKRKADIRAGIVTLEDEVKPAGQALNDKPKTEEILAEKPEEEFIEPISPLSEDQKAEVAKIEAEIQEIDSLNSKAYQTAIGHYESLLVQQPDNKENDQILYQLAAAYDLSGNEDKTLDTLDKLVSKHPKSPYNTEAEFRRGEIYFVRGDYLSSSEAYQVVQNSKTDTRFQNHALYKHGWSQFKVNEYELAVNDFIGLRDRLDKKIAKGKKQRGRYNSAADEKLITDTNHVIALSFSHLEGPEQMKNHFAKLGGRHYEHEVYKELYANYIHQERYRDAANTYDTFLDLYPTHKEAPLMQSAILQAYQDGGFPSLVLPGKIDYVKRFGINSEFWKLYVAEDAKEKVYTPEEREELLKVVKGHLADVSKHYHFIAQKSRKKKDYQVAATWYREYLDTFANKGGIDTEETLEVRKLLAESLYESEQYELAVVEFETLSKASGDNKEAGANASYFALLSYQKILKSYKGEQAGKDTLIAKKVESGNYFIEHYRDDKRMPNVLGNIIRDQIAVKDYTGAVANSRVLVNLDPPASKSMQKTAWVTIANAEFDAKDYANSEKSYQKVLTFNGFSKKQRIKYHRQVASSIYKNAESMKDKGELVAAAEEFLRLGRVVPASRIRPKAHFDAANLYLQAKEWHKAIKTLNVFKRLYPKHKLIETFPDKMAIAYKNTDQHEKASAEYLKIAQKYEKKDPELSRQSYWEAATLVEKTGDDNKSRELYREYANKFPLPLEENVEAQYKLVQLYEKTNHEYRISFWKDKIIKTHKKAGDKSTPRITFLAAKMSFEQIEVDFRRYRRIKLKQPLKRSLKKKKISMEKVLTKYQGVAKMGSAEYTTASNHRIARIYQILATDLIKSERPKGLKGDTLDQYDILIEDQAIPFEDKAIDVFVLNTNLVRDNVYDKWVKASFKELGVLIPGRYAKYEKRDEYVAAIY